MLRAARVPLRRGKSQLASGTSETGSAGRGSKSWQLDGGQRLSLEGPLLEAAKVAKIEVAIPLHTVPLNPPLLEPRKQV